MTKKLSHTLLYSVGLMADVIFWYLGLVALVALLVIVQCWLVDATLGLFGALCGNNNGAKKGCKLAFIMETDNVVRYIGL